MPPPSDSHGDSAGRHWNGAPERRAERDPLQLEQCHRVFESLSEGLLLYGPSGKLLLANAVARQVWQDYGLTPPDNHHAMLAGIEWLRFEGRLLAPEDCPSGRLLRGERFLNYEVTLRLKGASRDLEGSYSGVPVLDAEGGLVLGILTFRDTSERNRLQEDQQKLEREIHRAHRQEGLGGLVGGVAQTVHDSLGDLLRLPTLLAQEASPGSALQQDLDTIREACRSGQSLLQGLLDRTLRLPAHGPGLAVPPPGTGPIRPRRPLGVLVVDDEEVVRQSLASLVEALGHAPIAASSGEEALQMLLAETPVHLVILDLKMPGLGGMATLEALRRLRPDLPVVLVTGHADQEAEELCQRHRRVSLMPKPFTLAEIKAHLGLVQGLRG